MNTRLLLPAAIFLALLPLVNFAQSSKPKTETTKQYKLQFDLDPILAAPGLWDVTPEKLEELSAIPGFKNPPQFKWLTSDHSGARFSRKPYNNVSVDLTIFGGQLPVEEAVVNFKDGKVTDVNLSIFNRGDSGEISKGDFDTRYRTTGRLLGETLKVSPRERRPTAQTAVKTTGWLWTAPSVLALLEFNSAAMEPKGRPEFLRLKLSSPAGKDQLLGIAAIGRDATTLKPDELLKFVKKESDGDIFVSGIPMVDQGAKGYCVVASCQRMFEYLHVQCDQHELAEIAGSDAKRGTNSLEFAVALQKIGSRFKVHFKPLLAKHPGKADAAIKETKFAKLVQDHVNSGLPLLWSLELGLYPENGRPPLQKTGFHMRMVIGYNTGRNEVIFSDSWGAGHEMKRMSMDDAYRATTHLYAVEPLVRS
jgi:hypothetical protein